MKYHIPDKKDSTIVTQAVCAVLFCMFSFAWLFWFQADVIAVAQHVLSHGVTHYNRTVGALVLTGALLVLEMVVKVFTRLYGRSHALTFFPSMLVLAVISSVSTDIDRHFSFGAWPWVVPLLLIGWGGVAWFAGQLLPLDSDKDYSGLFSRRVWVNVLLMAAMMLAVAAVGNTNAVFHYRAHAEVALKHGDMGEALRVGENSLETDQHLTMLRAFALSRTGQLGEKLFCYPIAGQGKDLLPVGQSNSRLLLLSADTIWRHLGARPAPTMDMWRFLKAVERDTLATSSVADYVLCAHLVDRDLDAFVQALPKYYRVDENAADALPRHYREALTLYTHLRAHPLIVYHHAVMEEDWDNLQELERQYSNPAELKGVVANRYAGSYWYYYYFR